MVSQDRWRVVVIYFIGFIVSLAGHTPQEGELEREGGLDLFGVSMMMPLLPKYLYSLGGSRSLAGLIGSMYGAIQIFSSPTVGRISDEYGRRNVLLLVYFGCSLSYLVVALSHTLLLLTLARIVIGILKHGLSISKAYLVDISKPEDKASRLGYHNAISSAGFVIGPLVSGYLADRDPSLRLCFLVGTGVFTLDFFIVLFLLPSNRQTRPKSLQSSSSGSLLWLFNSELYHSVNIFHWRSMKGIIAIRFLVVLAVMIYRQNFHIFMEENLALSNADMGKVASYGAIAAVVGSATCGTLSKWYAGFSKHLFYGLLLLFVSLLMISVSSNIVSVLFFILTLSLSTSYLRICMPNLMLEYGQPDERGAILGFINSLSSLSRMLAPSVVGVLQEFGSLACSYLPPLLILSALLGVGIVSRSEKEHLKKKHS